MLLTEAIEALCIATRADGRSRRTVYAYREKLGHLVTFLGDVDVESVTVTDLRRFELANGLCDMFIADLDLRQGIAIVEKGKKPRFVMYTDDPL